jgi:hypothetical protein
MMGFVASFLALAQANFDCAAYVGNCSGVAGYEPYKNCAATVAVNDAIAMSCRIQHLALASSSGQAAVHCPHAQPNAQAPCNNEALKTFNCSLYESTCSGVSGYEAYQNCAATVGVNDANDMACRIQHLALAGTNAALHCPHAQPNAQAPCNNEALKTFDCSLYESTCSGVSGYEAYSDCPGTVAANGANGMACRIQHLQLAVSDAATHCPHAAPNATAPCNTETLTPPATTTIAAATAATTAATTGSVHTSESCLATLGYVHLMMLCLAVFTSN